MNLNKLGKDTLIAIIESGFDFTKLNNKDLKTMKEKLNCEYRRRYKNQIERIKEILIDLLSERELGNFNFIINNDEYLENIAVYLAQNKSLIDGFILSLK